MARGILALALAGLPGAVLRPPVLAHAAYVWQRAHGEAVGQAVREAPAQLAGLVWLAAEVDLRASSTARVSLALAGASGRPVGLAVRVRSVPGEAFASSVAPSAIGDALADVVARARAEGVEPTEAQLDFDCPTRHLRAVAGWIPQLRARTLGAPLTITALPSWIGAAGFDELVHATDGYVLQVHSLALPRSAGEAATLFDDLAARRAVARAATYGVAFRVALPTQGYAVTFDAAGRLSDVLAEEGDGSDTARELTAEPRELAGFLRWLSRSRPPEATSVLWFRLPTRDDHRSLAMDGLAALIRGDTPVARLVATAVRDADGAWAISVKNEGAVAARPAIVDVAFRGGVLDGFDALGRRATATDTKVSFEIAALAAHRSRAIGWVRLAGADETVEAHAR